MNNSKLAIDSLTLTEEQPVDNKPMLREKESSLIKVIDALQGISQTQEWGTLKSEVFDNLVVTLEKELRDEAKKETPDPLKLSRVAGQLKWAEKYSDLTKLEGVFRIELKRIRQMLYGEKSE